MKKQVRSQLDAAERLVENEEYATALDLLGNVRHREARRMEKRIRQMMRGEGVELDSKKKNKSRGCMGRLIRWSFILIAIWFGAGIVLGLIGMGLQAVGILPDGEGMTATALAEEATAQVVAAAATGTAEIVSQNATGTREAVEATSDAEATIAVQTQAPTLTAEAAVVATNRAGAMVRQTERFVATDNAESTATLEAMDPTVRARALATAAPPASATPTPETVGGVSVDFSIGESGGATFYSVGDANVRPCPRLSNACAPNGSVTTNQIVLVVGEAEGDIYQGSTDWYLAEGDDGNFFIHSTFLTDEAPPTATPTPTGTPEPLVFDEETVAILIDITMFDSGYNTDTAFIGRNVVVDVDSVNMLTPSSRIEFIGYLSGAVVGAFNDDLEAEVDVDEPANIVVNYVLGSINDGQISIPFSSARDVVNGDITGEQFFLTWTIR